MENKLELKHLAPYLPYGINFKMLDESSGEWEILPLVSVNIANETIEIGAMEIGLDELNAYEGIVLRPLSDLTKEIEHNGERFVPAIKMVDPKGKEWHLMKTATWKLMKTWQAHVVKVEHETMGEVISINLDNPLVLPYNLLVMLIEWHFDVFGLIDQGLAIDINTI